jgi:hypothetical protein
MSKAWRRYDGRKARYEQGMKNAWAALGEV